MAGASITDDPSPPFRPVYLVPGAILGSVAAWFLLPYIWAIALWALIGAIAGTSFGKALGAVGWSSLFGATGGVLFGDLLYWPLTGAGAGLIAGLVLALKGRPFAIPWPPRFARVSGIVLCAAVYVAACWLRVEACADCLPDHLTLATQFGDCGTPVVGGPGVFITVQRALFRVGAYCSNGKLVDRWGREVRFYRIPGEGPKGKNRNYWAMNEHIKELQKDYTVIEMFMP
jgi:hypothetical protein